MVEEEGAVGNLLNPRGDRVAVRRAERDRCLEHHQVEGAAERLRPRGKLLIRRRYFYIFYE